MGKKLTRTDIAQAAGVSPSTVSRALAGSDLLPEATIERVRKVAAEMGYQPNMLAKRLASNKSYQIGFVVPPGTERKGPFRMSYYSTILDAVVIGAQERGYSVNIQTVVFDDTTADTVDKMVASRQADGVILTGLTQDSKLPNELAQRNVPFALIGSEPIADNDNQILTVNCDPKPGITEMLSVLESKGYKRLFYMHGQLEYHDATLQKKTLEALISNSSLSLVDIDGGDYSRKSGYGAFSKWKDQFQKGDVAFLANDRMAGGFYRACYEHGKSIGADIGVIGSDDEDSSSVLFPTLSTIRQPRLEMGQAAVTAVIGVIEGAENLKSVLIDKVFVERGSI